MLIVSALSLSFMYSLVFPHLATWWSDPRWVALMHLTLVLDLLLCIAILLLMLHCIVHSQTTSCSFYVAILLLVFIFSTSNNSIHGSAQQLQQLVSIVCVRVEWKLPEKNCHSKFVIILCNTFVVNINWIGTLCNNNNAKHFDSIECVQCRCDCFLSRAP